MLPNNIMKNLIALETIIFSHLMHQHKGGGGPSSVKVHFNLFLTANQWNYLQFLSVFVII